MPTLALAAATLRTTYLSDITLAQGLTHLQQFLPPLAITHAKQTLEAAWAHIAILAQYQRCFPTEFALSRAKLLPDADEVYSECEWEFFTLADDRLFPLNLDAYGMEEEERTLAIPIVPCGVELFEDYDLRPGWAIMAYLAGEYNRDTLTVALADQHPEAVPLLIAAEHALPRIPATDCLADCCQRVEPPLAYLAPTLNMLLHQTDTTWLDPYEEQPLLDAYWYSANVDLLADEWRVAQVVMDHASSFLDWLEADPLIHIPEVVALWKSALRLPA